MKESKMFRIDKLMRKAQKKYDKEIAKKKLDKKEFEKMCQKAGIKKEALCDTIFTRQFKGKKIQKEMII